jgi:hypothetical protein
MPLYIKLDFGKDGNIHAWTSKTDSWSNGLLSESYGSTPKQCLHTLANKLGALENKTVGPEE